MSVASGAHRHPGQFSALASIGAVRLIAVVNLVEVGRIADLTLWFPETRHDRGMTTTYCDDPLEIWFLTICRDGFARI
ncbi:MAG: hypothetical protein IH987_07150 [Planctomycetes bacterium]|nr:hypothetical protein [Planctomycetota bacterium]